LAKAGFDTGRDNPAAPTHPPAQRQIRRLARRGVPAARRDADPIAAHLPRGRHAGTVFPRQCGSVGGTAARCSCGCRDKREGRGARWAMWREEFPLMVAWAFGGW